MGCDKFKLKNFLIFLSMFLSIVDIEIPFFNIIVYHSINLFLKTILK